MDGLRDYLGKLKYLLYKAGEGKNMSREIKGTERERKVEKIKTDSKRIEFVVNMRHERTNLGRVKLEYKTKQSFKGIVRKREKGVRERDRRRERERENVSGVVQLAKLRA